mmetsp:Transcript_40502/g.79848  ORF Transcript_40502/g.79848 Transcript_40502/m.79848 type:complete len:97 (-) Transcript_40502:453-743(-)
MTGSHKIIQLTPIEKETGIEQKKPEKDEERRRKQKTVQESLHGKLHPPGGDRSIDHAANSISPLMGSHTPSLDPKSSTFVEYIPSRRTNKETKKQK